MSGPTRFYFPENYIAERQVAECIKNIARTKTYAVKPITEGLDEDQAIGVELMCESSLTVVSGYPGTGKTTLNRRAVQSFDQAGMTGLIVAPAAKAAKRADEVLSMEGHDGTTVTYLDKPRCMTTFRGLEYNPMTGYGRNEDRKLDVDYVFIEEASMLGIVDAANVLCAIDPQRTRVIITGDPYQLPSVSPGNFLHDLISFSRVPSVKLTKIHRQGANSGIVQNANRILHGKMPIKADPTTGEPFKDFFFVPTSSEEETVQKILKWCESGIPKAHGFDPINDIQPLSPGKNSTVGTKNLNEKLRDVLNGGNPPMYRSFRLGDKVINRKNHYSKDIVNGDIGRVVDIGRQGMEVDFVGVGIVEVSGEIGESIQPAFAYTVHSSQGSEYACQILPLHRCHWTNLYQNLVYTGLTRGKKLSMLVGDPSAMQHAIQNTVTDKRESGLVEFLMEQWEESRDFLAV